MAFDKTELRVLVDSIDGEGRIWRYRTTDSIATVTAAGYFAHMGGNLTGSLLGDIGANGIKLGDIVQVQVVDSLATPTTVQNYTRSISSLTAGGGYDGTVNGVFGGDVVLEGQKVSSKASDAEVFYWVAQFAGYIAQIDVVLNGALATGDGTVTAAIGSTGVTGGVVTLTNAASAAGSKFSATPSALNVFAKGDVLKVTIGGASTATATCNVQLLCTRTS